MLLWYKGFLSSLLSHNLYSFLAFEEFFLATPAAVIHFPLKNILRLDKSSSSLKTNILQHCRKICFFKCCSAFTPISLWVGQGGNIMWKAPSLEKSPSGQAWINFRNNSWHLFRIVGKSAFPPWSKFPIKSSCGSSSLNQEWERDCLVWCPNTIILFLQKSNLRVSNHVCLLM